MKKVFFIAIVSLSLFASSEAVPFSNIQPPAIRAPITDISFDVFKGTRCRYLTALGGDLKPKCIELGIRQALGLNLDELKNYKGKEALAYLEGQRGNR